MTGTDAGDAGDAAVTVMLCFARSGGTVLNRCLGMLPNVVMLSEVNPLGGGWGPRGADSYTTVGAQAKHWYGIELKSDDFSDALVELADACRRRDRVLIVRDWSFIDFVPHEYNGMQPPRRFLTLDALESRVGVRPFAFVRNAIDVYLSRRGDTEAFFRDYLAYVRELVRRKVPIFRYEDFCRNPEGTLRALCRLSGARFSDAFRRYEEYENVNGDVQLGTASRGIRRRGIRPLKRKPVDADLRRRIGGNPDMVAANRLLGYPVSLGASLGFTWGRRTGQGGV